jgi:magnesium-protoporphyrin O-methyltransferase
MTPGTRGASRLDEAGQLGLPLPSPDASGEVSSRWAERRGAVRSYFEERAENWVQITSDAPLSGIRRTVREGRGQMRDELARWLLGGTSEGDVTVLDAGCGPGELSLQLAAAGARVTGVDLSQALVEAGEVRAREAGLADQVTLHTGDMLDPPGGPWQRVVAMDSFLYYDEDEASDGVARLASLAQEQLIFTVAPRTFLLGAMHRLGSLFPRRDRAQGIQPIRVESFLSRVLSDPRMAGWEAGRQFSVRSGFYFSHAGELRRGGG